MRPHTRLPIREFAFVSEATLVACPKCGRWFFVGHTGDTACRHCWTDEYVKVTRESVLNISKGSLRIDAIPVQEWLDRLFSGLQAG